MNKNNNLICDWKTGICGEAGEDTIETIDLNQLKKEKVKLYYVTDPICSHCWALEPVLRRFEEQYGHYVQIHTIMGGLLASWEGFADVKNGISQPRDVAEHWREVGLHSRMPIDGSLWLDHPIQSSYPASRVFKIIQQKDERLATTFLRRAREAVFAFNQNIGEDEVLIQLVNEIGIDGQHIIQEAALPAGQELLDQDFALVRSLGVRGFPTIIMVNEENKGIKIVGARALENYIDGLKQVLSQETLQAKAIPALHKLLEKESRLFSKEIEVLYDVEQSEIEGFIQDQLSPEHYGQKEILGESYIEKI